MDLNQKKNVADTKKAFLMALSWKNHGRSSASFELFIKRVWPTGVQRLGLKLNHIIAYTWNLK